MKPLMGRLRELSIIAGLMAIVIGWVNLRDGGFAWTWVFWIAFGIADIILTLFGRPIWQRLFRYWREEFGDPDAVFGGDETSGGGNANGDGGDRRRRW